MPHADPILAGLHGYILADARRAPEANPAKLGLHHVALLTISRELCDTRLRRLNRHRPRRRVAAHRAATSAQSSSRTPRIRRTAPRAPAVHVPTPSRRRRPAPLKGVGGAALGVGGRHLDHGRGIY